jgi:uncharacterized repeat protein (TIGR03803 family)
VAIFAGQVYARERPGSGASLRSLPSGNVRSGSERVQQSDEAFMSSKKTLTLLIAILIGVSGFLTITAFAFAVDNEKILHSFNYADGAYNTYADLIFDAAGNLYGTTHEGGASGSGCNGYGCGVVFQLTRAANGKWTEKVLHNFFRTDPLGYFPRAGLTPDAHGNLYGTTDAGGPFCVDYGCGAVFQLSPGKNGNWSGKVLYYFTGGSDGVAPQAPLTFDAAGNLYGTTSEGGDYYAGTVFQLTPDKNGTWTEKVLHAFNVHDGSGPHSRLIFDGAGNLYGTTAWGGADLSGCGGYGCGTAFQLARSKGTWTATLLHSFGKNKDGAGPWGDLVRDRAGNLYGITNQGGSHDSDCGGYGCGTVFQLRTGSNGKWTEKILHNFDIGKDGFWPSSGLILDAAGNLYGTTAYGGIYEDGNVFQLVRVANGKWTEKVLHAFNGKDGSNPYTGLIFDAVGNLYGTTASGGVPNSDCRAGCGVVFEIEP